MFERLDNLLKRREEIDTLLASPEVVADPAQLTRLGRERAALLPVVNAWERLQTARNELAEAKELASDEDPEVAALATEEAESLDAEVERLNEELREALLPKDPNDSKNVIMEIRGGAGGTRLHSSRAISSACTSGTHNATGCVWTSSTRARLSRVG